MEHERNLGVTEARFALTLLTCLLVAIGYVVLLRFGGVKTTAIEAGTDETSPPIVAAPYGSIDGEMSPRVLKLEPPDNDILRTSLRNKRAAPPHQPSESERR